MNKEDEIWKDIPNYEGYYQVSNIGSVKGLDRYVTYPNGRKDFINGRMLKLTLNSNGYWSVTLRKDGKSKTFHIHKLVAMAFLNHIPCGYKLVVNHINFNRLDNRVENLEVVTMRDNVNQKHLKENKSSKYTGVSWNKAKRKWLSHIRVDGVQLYLGEFNNEKEASEYYENALIAIEKGTEIVSKKPNFSSKYKGVCWDKSINKWTSLIIINGVKKDLGRFDSELEASNYYQNALVAIKNGEEIKVKKRVNSSKYKGVCWNKKNNNWMAYITIDSKSKHLGSYKTEEEAFEAVKNFNTGKYENEREKTI